MSIFPTRVLLATDGSKEAELAAATAANLAESTGSALEIVHVGARASYDGYSGTEADPLPKPYQDDLARRARGLLETEVGRTKSLGIGVAGSHLRRGRADEEIVLLAEEVHADLIVVGSRDVGRMERALVGSVSDLVTRHAHCPVLIARPEQILA